MSTLLDRVVRAQATELNAETMEDYGIANFRHRIDEYWDHHTVRPDTAREVLAVKKPNNYRPLWGRLPGGEAQAFIHPRHARMSVILATWLHG